MMPSFITTDTNFMPILEPYGFKDVEEIKVNDHSTRFKEVRSLCYLVLKRKGYNNRQIGEIFRRDRSTISTALKYLKGIMETDRQFRDAVFPLIEKCLS